MDAGPRGHLTSPQAKGAFPENFAPQVSELNSYPLRRYCQSAGEGVAAFHESGAQIGIVFETATPFHTPRLTAELVSWVIDKQEKGYLHPLLIIAISVVVFLEIHPFQDGNGRLSRVLTTLLLIQAGYAYVP